MTSEAARRRPSRTAATRRWSMVQIAARRRCRWCRPARCGRPAPIASGERSPAALSVRIRVTRCTSGSRADRASTSDVASGDRRPVHHRPFGGDDADVEAGGVQQIAERDEQSARQQQHVEEQRADDGDADDGQHGARRAARDRSPGEAPGGHRPTSARHVAAQAGSTDPTRPARMPSGTDTAIDCSAIGSRDAHEHQRRVVAPLEELIDRALRRDRRAGCRTPRRPMAISSPRPALRAGSSAARCRSAG